MKKFFKWFIIIALIFCISIFIYILFIKPTDKIEPIHLVPEDAGIIIETGSPFSNWDKITSNPVLNHLKNNFFFKELNNTISSLDTTINNNKLLFKLVGSRQVVLSIHLLNNYKYDFLFIVDLENISKLSIVKDEFTKFLGKDFSVMKRDYNKQEIIEIFHKETRETIYLSFIKNQLIGSYTNILIEKAINGMENPHFDQDLNYLEITKVMSGNRMFSVYLNYKYFGNYITNLLNQENEIIKNLSNQVYYTGLNFDLSNNGEIYLEGNTNINDSINSYLNVVLNSGKGKISCTEVSPDRTAIYTSFGFNNCLEFFQNFEN